MEDIGTRLLAAAAIAHGEVRIPLEVWNEPRDGALEINVDPETNEIVVVWVEEIPANND